MIVWLQKRFISYIRFGMIISWKRIFAVAFFPLVFGPFYIYNFKDHATWPSSEYFFIFLTVVGAVVAPLLVYGKLFGQKIGYDAVDSKYLGYQPSPALLGIAIGIGALVKLAWPWVFG